MITGKVISTAEVSPVVVRPKSDVQNLSPIDTVHVSAERLPLLDGRPRRGAGWAEVPVLLSTSGVTYNPEAFPPELTAIGSTTRFIANDISWDAQAATWVPFQTDNPEMLASAEIAAAPLLSEVQVQSGRRTIRTVKALNINQSTRMRLRLGQAVVERTITLVLDPTSSYWDIPIISTAGSVPASRFTSIAYTDKFDFLWNETGASVDPVAPIAKMSPVYLSLRITPPTVTLFVSYDYNKHFSATQASRGDLSATLMEFVLGTAAAHTNFSFRLFEVNLWDTPLADGEVVANHQKLMSIYGVNDAWG